MLQTIIKGFPVWAVLASFVAYLYPSLFLDFKSSIPVLLMIIMLSMGLTLKFDDFSRLSSFSKAMAVGILLQFSVMPCLAFFIAQILDLNQALTIGIVLVGSVAGGTASNVICYLAKGNVALSISMTAISTLLGVVFTPFLVESILSVSVKVPVQGMVVSLVQMVIIPVTIGVFTNQFLGQYTHRIKPVLPLISMLAIVFAIAIIVALNAAQLRELGAVVFFAVVLHNGLGLGLGYGICCLLGFDKTVSKTIAIEVGMQNSGLATALAVKFFTPLAALPAGIFSIWHNLSGSLLAYYWAKTTSEKHRKPVNNRESSK